jgi:hypothetical protein
MILIVRIFFLVGLGLGLFCFVLFFQGKGDRYKHLGFKVIMGTLLLTLVFFMIAIVQKVFLENQD